MPLTEKETDVTNYSKERRSRDRRTLRCVMPRCPRTPSSRQQYLTDLVRSAVSRASPKASTTTGRSLGPATYPVTPWPRLLLLVRPGGSARRTSHRQFALRPRHVRRQRTATRAPSRNAFQRKVVGYADTGAVVEWPACHPRLRLHHRRPDSTKNGRHGRPRNDHRPGHTRRTDQRRLRHLLSRTIRCANQIVGGWKRVIGDPNNPVAHAFRHMGLGRSTLPPTIWVFCRPTPTAAPTPSVWAARSSAVPSPSSARCPGDAVQPRSCPDKPGVFVGRRQQRCLCDQ